MMNAMNLYPTDPLTQLLPFIALGETSVSSSNNDNVKKLILMSMLNPNAVINPRIVLFILIFRVRTGEIDIC